MLDTAMTKDVTLVSLMARAAFEEEERFQKAGRPISGTPVFVLHPRLRNVLLSDPFFRMADSGSDTFYGMADSGSDTFYGASVHFHFAAEYPYLSPRVGDIIYL